MQCNGQAHTEADTGGEFLAAYQTDLTFADPGSWVIPTQDLINVYASTGTYVNASWIEECAIIFSVGEWAIKNLAALIEPLELQVRTFSRRVVQSAGLGSVQRRVGQSARRSPPPIPG